MNMQLRGTSSGVRVPCSRGQSLDFFCFKPKNEEKERFGIIRIKKYDSLFGIVFYSIFSGAVSKATQQLDTSKTPP